MIRRLIRREKRRLIKPEKDDLSNEMIRRLIRREKRRLIKRNDQTTYQMGEKTTYQTK